MPNHGCLRRSPFLSKKPKCADNSRRFFDRSPHEVLPPGPLEDGSEARAMQFRTLPQKSGIARDVQSFVVEESTKVHLFVPPRRCGQRTRVSMKCFQPAP